MRRPGPPGHRPGKVQPRLSLVFQQPPSPLANVPPPPFWACASSGQITLNSWFVYDATAGPVHPPSIDAPLNLPDTGIVQTRQLGRALASETINAVGIAAGEFLPQFVAQWFDFDIPKRVFLKLPFPDTVNPVGIAAGEFLPQFVSQWSDPNIPKRAFPKTPLPDTVNPVGIAAGEFLPNFVSQWHELAALTRVRRINAAVASSTDAGRVPDVTTPVATNWFDIPTEIRRLPPPAPFPPTQIVVAIPVDDLWFEALDVPIRLKGTKFALASSEAAAPIFQPVVVPPPQVLPDATVFARLKVKQILAESAAPIGVVSGQPVPPPTLGADWLESTARVLSARKILSDTVDAIFPFPPPPSPPPPDVDHGRGMGGKPPRWRNDLGPHWRYRKLKKKEDLEAELEELEEVVEEDVPQEIDQNLRDVEEEERFDELTERSQRLIEAIEAATQKAKAKAARLALEALQARAIEVRRKIAEEEEEMAAWLLLHLL